jgi:hypothetical protein
MVVNNRKNSAQPETSTSPLLEISRVLVRFDHVAGPGKLLIARGAGASCGGSGFARDTTTFDIFTWLQVTANFGDVALLQSAPNRPDYIDVWVLWLHGHDF